MKLSFLLKIMFIIIILSSQHIIYNTNSLSITTNNTSKLKFNQPLSTVEKFKFLFMLKWPSVRNDKLHPLNVLSYKNVLLSTSQIVFFVSPNPSNSQADETWDTSHYIFTMQYENLDLPCLNRSYICTHNQFIKEYRPLYPELNFNIPSEVVERFVDAKKASLNCLLIFLSPPISLEDAAWLCHDNIGTVYRFQDKLSKIIRDSNSKSYDFMADYIMDKSERISGVVSLNQQELHFRDMIGKLSLSINYDEINPYAIALYLKENLQWTGGIAVKPEDARCFKIQRKGSAFLNSPDYFCIFWQRNDISMRVALNIIQARFQAELYANKINIRLQNQALNKSLEQMNKIKGNIEVQSSILFPIKNQVRNDYFIVRHKLLANLKMNKITRDYFESEIQKSKEKIINSVCSGIESCKKAIQMSLNNGLLPLNGYRERFAMDIQNPFNSLVPKSSLRINLPHGGSVGKKLIEQVKDLITNSHDTNYMPDSIPESAPGEIPNDAAIKKAFNTIQSLRDENVAKRYFRIEELGQNCRINTRHNSYNLKRKISMLSYIGDHDTFFEYLGRIRNRIVFGSGSNKFK